MLEIENIDFNNPSEEVLFKLCMGEIKTRNNILEKFGLDHLKVEEKDTDINIIEHRDILAKFDLQSFSELLFEHQKNWFLSRESTQDSFNSYHHDYPKKLAYKLKVSKVLKMFMSNDLAKKKIKVDIADLRNKFIIDDINLLNAFQESFKKEFDRLELNETELTRKEAIEEIKSVEDFEWLDEYGNFSAWDGFNINFEFVDEEMIDAYMWTHVKPREVTLELVENVIVELETWINRSKLGAGAKNKNLNIGQFAKRLSYLHRIDDFLHQNKYDSINDTPLSNKTCRFIYRYFEFLGLIPDDVIIDGIEKGKRANYIRSLIRNNENISQKRGSDYIKAFYRIQKEHDLRINLFKKVRSGVLVPEEFYERINPPQD